MRRVPWCQDYSWERTRVGKGFYFVIFAILVLSKFYKGRLYLTRWKEIRQCLPSRVTNKELYKHIKFYCDRGLLNVHGQYHDVAFINEDSFPAITISGKNIYKLAQTYEEWFGKDVFTCSDCGREVARKPRAHSQKVCDDCSKIRHGKSKWLSKVKQKQTGDRAL